MKKNIQTLITGFLIGIANIIPGVSGGTFLLIFGIYERTIAAINGTVVLLKEILVFLSHIHRKEKRNLSLQNIASHIKSSDLLFLSQIILGALVAIIVLSSLMKMLLTHYFSPTYAFFFGLIALSISIPYGLIKKPSLACLPFFALGLILTVIISMSVNPSDKVLGKSAIYKNRLDSQTERVEQSETAQKPFGYTGKYSIKEFSYAALSGAIAISAMVLPGISGSLVLILMGQYFEVISAIAGLKTLQLDYVLFLGMIFLGIIVGIVLFARFIEYIFKQFYDPTISFLTGLTAGSLYALWPFKKYLVQDIYVKEQGIIKCIQNSTVYTNQNSLPDTMQTFILATVFCLLGMAIMWFMVKVERGKEKREK